MVVTLLNKNSRILKVWKDITLFFLNVMLVLFFLSLYFLLLLPNKIEKHPNKMLYPIVSKSMYPTLKLYDAVIMEKKDIKEVQVGILFRMFQILSMETIEVYSRFIAFCNILVILNLFVLDFVQIKNRQKRF